MTKTKSLTLDLKAAGEDAPEGSFNGYASVFGNKDSYGDVVIAGAFAESLKTYGENGAGIPCYWSHQMNDPKMCIGWTTKAVEDEHGLYVEVKLDLENPNGAQAHKLMKAGVVRQMSFAFAVNDYAFAENEELGQHVELRELDIFEVSVVQVGANQETEILDAKSRLDSVKSRRDLTTEEGAKLDEAIGLLTEVLGGFERPKADDGATSSDEEPSEAKAEERETANAEEPSETKSRTPDAADIAAIRLRLINL